MSALFHYTDRVSLLGILRSGVIEARTRSPWYNPHGIPPLVWCSSELLWEPTSSAGVVIGPSGDLPPDIVPGHPYEAARIAVADASTEEWDIAMAKCGAHWSTIMRVAQAGYNLRSDPKRWRASRKALPVQAWLGVELWDGARWVPVRVGADMPNAADLVLFLLDKGIKTHGRPGNSVPAA